MDHDPPAAAPRLHRTATAWATACATAGRRAAARRPTGVRRTRRLTAMAWATACATTAGRRAAVARPSNGRPPFHEADRQRLSRRRRRLGPQARGSSSQTPTSRAGAHPGVAGARPPEGGGWQWRSGGRGGGHEAARRRRRRLAARPLAPEQRGRRAAGERVHGLPRAPSSPTAGDKTILRSTNSRRRRRKTERLERLLQRVRGRRIADAAAADAGLRPPPRRRRRRQMRRAPRSAPRPLLAPPR